MRTILAWCAALFAGLGLLFGGCAWGLVTDAETGEGVEGASVIYVDSKGEAGAKLTGAGGHYQFDAVKGDRIPATGRTTFIVLAPGYQTLVVERQVAYDDYDKGIWEVQDFQLTRLRTPTPTPSPTPTPTRTPTPTAAPSVTPAPTSTPVATAAATATATPTATAVATPTATSAP